MDYEDKLCKTEKPAELKPGRYLAKVVKIETKDAIKHKLFEREIEVKYTIPTATVLFEVIEGKFKGNHVSWKLKLDDDFSPKQQANSREMLNEFLENVDRDRLLTCKGSVCYVMLQKWAMEGRQGVFVAATQSARPDLSLQDDNDFLSGDLK